MIYLGFTLGILAIALFFALSKTQAAGQLSQSGLNPYLILVFYFVLVQLDFLTFYIDGFGVIARSVITAPTQTLAEVLISHNIIGLLLGLGCLIGAKLSRNAPSKPVAAISPNASALLLAAITLPYLLPVISQFLRGESLLLLGAENHTGEQGAVTFFFSMAILPAWTFFLLGRRLVPATVVFLFLAVLLIGTGSRTRVLYLIIPFVFFLHFHGLFFFRRVYFAIGLAVGLLMATAAVNYRIAVTQFNQSQVDVAALFSTENFMRQNDVAFAEVGVMMADGQKELAGYPGENFVGAALSPIPRSIIPFKPNTGSVQFTQAYDDRHYYRHGRALTIGGIMEIFGDYPLLPGALIAFLLGAGWSYFLALTTRKISTIRIADIAILYILIFAFLRIDLQAASQVMWAYLAIRTLLVGLSKLGLRRAKRPTIGPRGDRKFLLGTSAKVPRSTS